MTHRILCFLTALLISGGGAYCDPERFELGLAPVQFPIDSQALEKYASIIRSLKGKHGSAGNEEIFSICGFGERHAFKLTFYIESNGEFPAALDSTKSMVEYTSLSKVGGKDMTSTSRSMEISRELFTACVSVGTKLLMRTNFGSYIRSVGAGDWILFSFGSMQGMTRSIDEESFLGKFVVSLGEISKSLKAGEQDLPTQTIKDILAVDLAMPELDGEWTLRLRDPFTSRKDHAATPSVRLRLLDYFGE